MVTFYRTLGILVLLTLLWVNVRGWAPGTRHEPCLTSATAGAARDCRDQSPSARRERARTQRGRE
jgi:hypothetical protein